MGLLFNAILLAGLVAIRLLFGEKQKDKRPELEDHGLPTAEAGRPIIEVYGTVLIEDANLLAQADKRTNTYKIRQ